VIILHPDEKRDGAAGLAYRMIYRICRSRPFRAAPPQRVRHAAGPLGRHEKGM